MNTVEKDIEEINETEQKNNPMATNPDTQSFWDHLDVLRIAIMKIVAVSVVFGVVFFSQRTVVRCNSCSQAP